MPVNLATGFPISLPWWSFALGLGFSATVGIRFGMLPAIRASRLDPIEALRYRVDDVSASARGPECDSYRLATMRRRPPSVPGRSVCVAG
jgi:hypothetical protein